MNQQISWDPTLVKKFSCTNHYKLLNQLRNEVIKYPLNYKKKSSSILVNDTNQAKKSKSNTSHIQEASDSYNSSEKHDDISNKSTVSFNNAKNFTIYNKSQNNNQQNELSLPDQSKLNEDSYSQTFKERLNQIDMK
tara:strand:+ start:275 stop:682 length:408 start_codon:yes stop_codon:yes gene_type:complete